MDVHRRQLESAQTELFEHHQRASEASEARIAEADMLVHDVEAWQQRATLAEKEVESLREKLEANPSAKSADWDDLQSNIQGKVIPYCRLATSHRPTKGGGLQVE